MATTEPLTEDALQDKLPLVLDNIVDDAYATLLHNYVKKLPFHFEENVNRVALRGKPTAAVLHGIESDIAVFVSGIYCHGEKRPDMFMHLINATAKKLGIRVGMEHLIRIKANILPPLLTKSHNRINLPHTDTNIPHLVFLYYLNDCDGDTIMFNKQRLDKVGHSDPCYMDDLAITHTITPKKNRMLVFDGSWFHTSSVPTQDYRMVVNINISYPGVISDYSDPAAWGY